MFLLNSLLLLIQELFFLHILVLCGRGWKTAATDFSSHLRVCWLGDCAMAPLLCSFSFGNKALMCLGLGAGRVRVVFNVLGLFIVFFSFLLCFYSLIHDYLVTGLVGPSGLQMIPLRGTMLPPMHMFDLSMFPYTSRSALGYKKWVFPVRCENWK